MQTKLETFFNTLESDSNFHFFDDTTKEVKQNNQDIQSIHSCIKELINTNRLNENVIDKLNLMINADNFLPKVKEQKVELLRGALQNISFPENIAQHSRGTCTVTVCEKLISMQDPAKYLDIINSLASKNGIVSSDLISYGKFINHPKYNESLNLIKTSFGYQDSNFKDSVQRYLLKKYLVITQSL